jgi:hypothetical protein
MLLLLLYLLYLLNLLQLLLLSLSSSSRCEVSEHGRHDVRLPCYLDAAVATEVGGTNELSNPVIFRLKISLLRPNRRGLCPLIHTARVDLRIRERYGRRNPRNLSVGALVTGTFTLSSVVLTSSWRPAFARAFLGLPEAAELRSHDTHVLFERIER